ncbi:S-adenosylmethionine transporter [Serendipita sp. 411]|nr:S-adenosylmethionine transporter [Serendipita sp. 411]
MPPAFTDSLIAGGVAGTSVDLLFFPIDTLKTRLQSSQGFIKAGGFKGVYKGVGSVALGSAPGAAAFFTTYDTLKKTIKFAPGWEPLTHLVSASCGEVVACIIRVPTEVVKSRIRIDHYARDSVHLDPVSCVRVSEDQIGGCPGKRAWKTSCI